MWVQYGRYSGSYFSLIFYIIKGKTFNRINKTVCVEQFIRKEVLG